MRYTIVSKENQTKSYYVIAIETELAIGDMEKEIKSAREWLVNHRHCHWGSETYDLMNQLQQTNAISRYFTILAIKDLKGDEIVNGKGDIDLVF